MKLLNSVELTEYIEERQAHEVRALRQASHITPKLQVGDAPKDLLQEIHDYGADILVDVVDNEVAESVEPAGVTAILWLLAGYNVEIHAGKHVLIIGDDEVLGKPLAKTFETMGVLFTILPVDDKKLTDEALEADVVVITSGEKAVLYPNMIKPNATIVNASESADVVAESVYDRDDIKITPPNDQLRALKICAMFENAIRAARATVNKA